MKHEFATPGKKTISRETWMYWENFAVKTVTFMKNFYCSPINVLVLCAFLERLIFLDFKKKQAIFWVHLKSVIKFKTSDWTVTWIFLFGGIFRHIDLLLTSAQSDGCVSVVVFTHSTTSSLNLEPEVDLMRKRLTFPMKVPFLYPCIQVCHHMVR